MQIEDNADMCERFILEIDSTMLKSLQNMYQCWLLCLHPKIIKTKPPIEIMYFLT